MGCVIHADLDISCISCMRTLGTLGRMCVMCIPSLPFQSIEDARIKELEQQVTKSKQALEEMSAQLSAKEGELEATRRKCKVAEDEAQTIRERAQIHFGTEVEPYMTEITHLRKMVGRLSKQVQEQGQQITERDEELKKIKSNPTMMIAKDQTVAQLQDQNERLRRDIEEADIKMKSLMSDKEFVEEVSFDEIGECMLAPVNGEI